MKTQTRLLLAFLLLASSILASCTFEGDSDSNNPAQPSQSVSDQFEVDFARVNDLELASRAIFTPAGNDLLTRGEVEGLHVGDRQFAVRLTGTLPNTNYDLRFCSFANILTGCLALGTVRTDGNGNANLNLSFAPPGSYAGVFLIQRAGLNQFVTGFLVPDPQNPESNTFDVDLMRAANLPGGLGVGFAEAGSDPLASGQVEVNRDGRVRAMVSGAVASATYEVSFCRFGLGPAGCLAIGSLATTAQGNGQITADFPASGRYAGIFVLSRAVDGQNRIQFVTGIVVP